MSEGTEFDAWLPSWSDSFISELNNQAFTSEDGIILQNLKDETFQVLGTNEIDFSRSEMFNIAQDLNPKLPGTLHANQRRRDYAKINFHIIQNLTLSTMPYNPLLMRWTVLYQTMLSFAPLPRLPVHIRNEKELRTFYKN